jgi:hypothetical protein
MERLFVKNPPICEHCYTAPKQNCHFCGNIRALALKEPQTCYSCYSKYRKKYGPDYFKSVKPRRK